MTDTRPSSRPSRPREGFSREMPHSLEAEKAVISGCVLTPGLIIPTADITPTGAFHHEGHQLIFGAIVELHENGDPVNFATIGDLLNSRGDLAKAGGGASLSEILTFLPTSADHDHYVGMVAEKAWLREVIGECGNVIATARANQAEIDVVREAVGQTLLALTQERAHHKRPTLGEVARELRKIVERGSVEEALGISTGFKNLDAINARLRKGGMVMIGGEISGGKSALAWNIIRHLSIDREFDTAYFSAEMSRTECLEYLAEIVSGVNTAAVVERRVGETAIADYMAALDTVACAKLQLFGSEDCGDMSFDQVGAQCRALKAKNPDLRVIVIDYDELFIPDVIRNNSNKEMELTRISKRAKKLAAELDLTIILLSQLTVDTQTGKASLRGSRGKAADATQVWIMQTDGQTVRNLTVGKNRFSARDEELCFTFTGHNKRFRVKEDA